MNNVIQKALLLAYLLLPIGAIAEIEEYILQPGDVIAISVVEHPEFSGRHKIRPDGRINYPVIGEIAAAPLTCDQLVKIMQGKLSSYINNPVVSISIEAYYANKIFIIGDVSRSGEYQIYEPVDIIKAIAMSGGLKNAKVGSVRIIRGDGNVVEINMKEVWGNGEKRDNRKLLLYPGDTMYVPESFEIPWGFLATVLGVVSVALQIALNVTRLNS